MSDDHVISAAQAALAGEHAALYAYSVCGGVVDPASAESVRIRDGYAAHRTRRDQLEGALRDLGAEPVAAAPGYDLPVPVTSSGSAARVLGQVEDRASVAYAGLVAASAGTTRRGAVGWLRDAALRGLAWGRPPAAFPGLQAR